VEVRRPRGLTENAGHENAGHENAGHENDGPKMMPGPGREMEC